ncbi:hypothetical protein SUNI508_08259 [Seiridium unicorne]|uniref:Uncharacterized protein n=1 Tax=Seiridium unicorne TaxID=138068 RepID=A0ABR2UUG4_9PEZI
MSGKSASASLASWAVDALITARFRANLAHRTGDLRPARNPMAGQLPAKEGRNQTVKSQAMKMSAAAEDKEEEKHFRSSRRTNCMKTKSNRTSTHLLSTLQVKIKNGVIVAFALKDFVEKLSPPKD